MGYGSIHLGSRVEEYDALCVLLAFASLWVSEATDKFPVSDGGIKEQARLTKKASFDYP